MKATLAKFAQQELGRGASGTDFVVSWVESGHTITELAKKLAEEMGESCSRSFLATVINRHPEDKQRITAARAEAAHVLIDQALAITDEPALSTVDVQRNRLRAETRAKIAGWWNRQEYGEAKPAAVQIDIGKLHIEAMRAVTARRLRQTAPMAAEVIQDATSPSAAVAEVMRLREGQSTH